MSPQMVFLITLLVVLAVLVAYIFSCEREASEPGSGYTGGARRARGGHHRATGHAPAPYQPPAPETGGDGPDDITRYIVPADAPA
jgi:hypothetical protein